MRYQLNVNLKNFDLKHAGTKAVTDCEHVLNSRGYKNISLVFNKSPFWIGFSLIKLVCQLIVWTTWVKTGSLIIIQYPLIGINHFFKLFIHVLKLKKCKVACIIHDINTIRNNESDYQVSKEIKYLNAYDLIITHNNKMTEWLKSKRLTTQTFPIQIFDYLYKDENEYNRLKDFSKNKLRIVFAGNLNRGKFIYNLFQINRLQFLLYGSINNSVQILKQVNVEWKGTYGPEDLVTKLEGTMGLIWDGDDITACNGRFGNYIKYNNPHKLSLYIAAGLPVIVPAKAALREFVEKNNIGISINSLEEIDVQLNKVTIEAYKMMLENVTALRHKLKHGYFFSTCLNRIEEEYNYPSKFNKAAIINTGANKLTYEKVNLQS